MNKQHSPVGNASMGVLYPSVIWQTMEIVGTRLRIEIPMDEPGINGHPESDAVSTPSKPVATRKKRSGRLILSC